MSDVVIRLGEVEEVPVNVGEEVYIKGDKGDTFFPHVSENGDLSWSNDGGLPNPPTVNIKGPQGEPGNYTKPASGIPKSDLESAVQASLDKADTALQEHQSLAAYRTATAQDTIDAGKLGTSGDGSNVTAAFTAASTRDNITTGEKLSVIFGKIAKWLTDLGTAAFRAATSSISSGSTDLVESGAVYTALDDKVDKVQSATNGNFAALDANGNLTDSGHKHSDYASSGTSVPSGGSTGQVLKKKSATDYDTEWGNVGDVTADMLGIVINGNSTTVGAAVGQYVIVKNSTISGITDGLYKAAKAIPANTAINSTYLTAFSGGGLNDLTVSTPLTTLFDDTHRQIYYLTYPALKLLFVFAKSDGTTYTAGDYYDFHATLPSTIVPFIATSVVTRKHGFITVASTRDITFRLMKDQIWDQGCVIIPYL